MYRRSIGLSRSCISAAVVLICIAQEVQLQKASSEKALHQKQYIELFTNNEWSPTAQVAGAGDKDGSDSDLDSDKISIASEGCDSGSIFYSFNPDCQKAISAVVERLLAEKNTTVLIREAENLKRHPRLNRRVWYTALTIVTFARTDLRGLWKPSPLDVIPDSFINSKAVAQAQTLRSSDECVLLDETFAKDNGLENQFWYFREDIQVNSQHWFWHQINSPFAFAPQDRQGELFFYFHHSMLQRYNADRLAHGLKRIVSFRLANPVTVEEGYNPHLIEPLSSEPYGFRLTSTKMPNSGRLNITIQYNERILKSIDQGLFYRDNPNRTEKILPLDGSDKLGSTVEPSSASVNGRYYGNLHGTGHVLIAGLNVGSNPGLGVMGDTTTAMRDPLFYRWHNYINDISDRYKRTLTPYMPSTGDFPLSWPGVQLANIEVYPTLGPQSRPLQTFWSVKAINLTRRLDLNGPDGPPIQICAKHLNHEDFGYHLVVNDDRNSGALRNATVRIFMAPRYPEDGRRFNMEEQRNLFFVMDTFRTTLKPGINVIIRHSSESTLTIQWDPNLAELSDTKSGPPSCGCGWPEHLLLPKGNSTGMAFDVFAMITNRIEDSVGDEIDPTTKDSCRSAPLLCGIVGKKYPDKKPMGYPFDRVPFKLMERQGQWFITRDLKDLDEYVSYVPNMATTQITIVHEDKIRT